MNHISHQHGINLTVSPPPFTNTPENSTRSPLAMSLGEASGEEHATPWPTHHKRQNSAGIQDMSEENVKTKVYEKVKCVVNLIHSRARKDPSLQVRLKVDNLLQQWSKLASDYVENQKIEEDLQDENTGLKSSVPYIPKLEYIPEKPNSNIIAWANAKIKMSNLFGRFASYSPDELRYGTTVDSNWEIYAELKTCVEPDFDSSRKHNASRIREEALINYNDYFSTKNVSRDPAKSINPEIVCQVPAKKIDGKVENLKIYSMIFHPYENNLYAVTKHSIFKYLLSQDEDDRASSSHSVVKQVSSVKLDTQPSHITIFSDSGSSPPHGSVSNVVPPNPTNSIQSCKEWSIFSEGGGIDKVELINAHSRAMFLCTDFDHNVKIIDADTGEEVSSFNGVFGSGNEIHNGKVVQNRVV